MVDFAVVCQRHRRAARHPGPHLSQWRRAQSRQLLLDRAAAGARAHRQSCSGRSHVCMENELLYGSRIPGRFALEQVNALNVIR